MTGGWGGGCGAADCCIGTGGAWGNGACVDGCAGSSDDGDGATTGAFVSVDGKSFDEYSKPRIIIILSTLSNQNTRTWYRI